MGFEACRQSMLQAACRRGAETQAAPPMSLPTCRPGPGAGQPASPDRRPGMQPARRRDTVSAMDGADMALGLGAELRAVVGEDGVILEPADLIVYECEDYTLEKPMPAAVVLPCSTAEVVAVVERLHARRIPFVPRGAG